MAGGVLAMTGFTLVALQRIIETTSTIIIMPVKFLDQSYLLLMACLPAVFLPPFLSISLDSVSGSQLVSTW